MVHSVSLQSSIDTHTAPLLVMDRELRIVAANRACSRYFGEFSGIRDAQAVAETFAVDREARLKLRRDFFTSLEPYTCQETRRFGDQPAQEVRCHGFPLHAADGTMFLAELISPVAGASGQAPDDGMVGCDPAFLKARDRLARAGRAPTSVLVVGESGTGKELAARFVHDSSARADKPFVTVDCTVLGEGLIESELFGHERGAFTGSARAKQGLFELADGGTLFLDELGELPLGLQAKLLRAVEYGTFRRVGGTRTHKVDVRVVAATNRDLPQMVKDGRFRQDLYYRLAVFSVRLPSLRERLSDVPLLVDHLLREFSRNSGRVLALSDDARMALLRHSFPGNIRELRNLLQVGAALCEDGLIQAHDMELQSSAWAFGEESSPAPGPELEVVRDDSGEDDTAAETTLKPLHHVEAGYIRELLGRFNNNRSLVAEHMGVSTRTLSRKIKRYNLR